ncbi:MAG: TolC family protein, partial [Balneolaceae bacterium]
TERSLQAAERAYETQQQRYDIGAASLIELNQATTDYMEAMSSRQQVIYNFVFQEKLLDYYIGRITDDVSL